MDECARTKEGSKDLALLKECVNYMPIPDQLLNDPSLSLFIKEEMRQKGRGRLRGFFAELFQNHQISLLQLKRVDEIAADPRSFLSRWFRDLGLPSHSPPPPEPEWDHKDLMMPSEEEREEEEKEEKEDAVCGPYSYAAKVCLCVCGKKGVTAFLVRCGVRMARLFLREWLEREGAVLPVPTSEGGRACYAVECGVANA